MTEIAQLNSLTFRSWVALAVFLDLKRVVLSRELEQHLYLVNRMKVRTESGAPTDIVCARCTAGELQNFLCHQQSLNCDC